MAENQNVGSGPESGSAGTPNQTESPEASQPIGGDVTKLLADLESKFSAKLSQIESRMGGMREVQSKIDTAQNDFQKQLARLNEYKAQGLSDTEALAEMQADDANDQWRQSLEQKIDNLAAMFGSGGTQANAQQNMVTAALSEYGLDPKDPFVAGKMAGQNPANKTEAELLAARIFRDKTKAPQTNPSQQSAQPGAASVPQDVQSKIDLLTELQKFPTRNKAEIMRLTAELEAVNWGGR